MTLINVLCCLKLVCWLPCAFCDANFSCFIVNYAIQHVALFHSSGSIAVYICSNYHLGEDVSLVCQSEGTIPHEVVEI
jgi:hypothetical protein